MIYIRDGKGGVERVLYKFTGETNSKGQKKISLIDIHSDASHLPAVLKSSDSGSDSTTTVDSTTNVDGTTISTSTTIGTTSLTDTTVADASLLDKLKAEANARTASAAADASAALDMKLDIPSVFPGAL